MLKSIIVLSLALLPVGSVRAEDRGPRYFDSRPGALAETKERLAKGDASLQPALDALIQRADAALKVSPPSVTKKTKPAPSGDIHDYASTAPYQWPNPDTPNGLPYIRKDGVVYPGSRTDESDLERIKMMAAHVNTLALAYHFTGQEAYAEKAARFLRVWFLDPDTLMNPRLEFPQGVPGQTNGRPGGIFEGSHASIAAEASALLAGSEAWQATDQKALDAWLNTYLDWLLESPLGQEAAALKQNHGTAYDVQVVRLALILGRDELAKKILEAVKEKRIASQITPAGLQPLEAGRTKGFGYSRLNLGHLMTLATFGEWVGVDLWNYRTEYGRSIRKATDFLIPYVNWVPGKWPYQQIEKVNPADMAPLLRRAAIAYHDTAYEQAIKDLSAAPEAAFRLTDPLPPVPPEK